MKIKGFIWAFILVCLVAGSGCVSGMYHQVGPGENLFRISEAYGVTQEEILQVNRSIMKDPDEIYVGQYIFIPGAMEPKEVMVASAAPVGEAMDASPMHGETVSPSPCQNDTQPAGIVVEDLGSASRLTTATPPEPAPKPEKNAAANTQARAAVPAPVVKPPVPVIKPVKKVTTPKVAPPEPQIQIIEEKKVALPAGKKGSFRPHWPARGSIVSPYGKRNGKVHEGVDIGGMAGSPIVAAEAGKVMFSGVLKGYGKVVMIKHDGVYSTLYAHNRKNLVKEGAYVQKGQRIAEMGKTGRASGVHLHFEVLENRMTVNPQKFLSGQ